MAVSLTKQKAIWVGQRNPSATNTSSPAILTYSYDRAYIKFNAPASSYQFLVPSSVEVTATVRNNATDRMYFMHVGMTALTEWKDSATYTNKPKEGTTGYTGGNSSYVDAGTVSDQVLYLPYTSVAEKYTQKAIADMLKYGTAIYLRPSTGTLCFDSTIDLNATAKVTFSSTKASLAISSCSPTSGYIPKHGTSTFSWSTYQNGYCYADLSTSSAKIRWKTSAAGSVTEVNCGTATSYTFPADTFSTDTVMWQLSITDNGGTTTTSDWFTLSTVEALPETVATYPKNTMIDGSVDNVFTWEHIITTGTAQTSAQLQKSQNGSSWSTIGNVTGSSTSFNVAANTFDAGQWYWRVKSANTDNTFGEWSSAAPFLVVSAPQKPTVSATQTPRPVISWQASGQQGFQVVVDDLYDSGAMFGTDTALKLPFYLSNGVYTAKVCVQNVYGLWSEYGTAPIDVSNGETNGINLSVVESSTASLIWSTNGTFDSYIVYRDGNAIARTNIKNYTDPFSVGFVSYNVIGIHNDSDNYGTSNTVSVDVVPETLIIIDYETREQMDLKLSDASRRSTTISNTVSTSSYYVYGSKYAVFEKSGHERKTMSFRCAFADSAEAEEFKKLLGRTVCVKTQRREKVLGILATMNETQIAPFYTAFSCTVEEANIDEGIEI